MATVWIPPLMRDLTGGKSQVEVQGTTVRELVDNLDAQFPGFKERLVMDGDLRPDVAAVIDGTTARLGLRQRLQDGSEVHFVPAISGGRACPTPTFCRR